MPALQIIRVHAGSLIALNPDLLHAAAIQEVVDVGTGKSRRNGGVHGRNIKTECGKLLVVEIQLHLRRVIHAVVANHRQPGILMRRGKELVPHFHQLLVSLALLILNEEVEAIRNAEFRHSREREDERACILEFRRHHEGAHGAALNGLHALGGIRAFSPVLELQEAQRHVLAGTRKGEAAHGKEAVERLLFRLLQEPFHAAKFTVRTLHRSPLRKLHREERHALVFSRHEPGRKLDEADHHSGDHSDVADD